MYMGVCTCWMAQQCPQNPYMDSVDYASSFESCHICLYDYPDKLTARTFVVSLGIETIKHEASIS